MFFIFPVLAIINLLKSTGQYPKGVFKNLSCARQSAIENTFMKVEVISSKKSCNMKGFNAKASSAMKANGDFLSDNIHFCCRFWNIEQVSINCHS